MIRNSSCNRRISNRISSRRFASRLLSGSSSSSTSGSITIARAKLTRCCCPPDSSAGYRSINAPSFTTSRIAATRRRISSRGSFRTCNPNATFSPTVMFGQIA